MPDHTQTPWRIGNAGTTIFSPPNGEPSPVTIAVIGSAKGAGKANAAFIVRAVNAHDELVAALEALFEATREHIDEVGNEEQLAARDGAATVLVKLKEGAP